MDRIPLSRLRCTFQLNTPLTCSVRQIARESGLIARDARVAILDSVELSDAREGTPSETMDFELTPKLILTDFDTEEVLLAEDISIGQTKNQSVTKQQSDTCQSALSRADVVCVSGPAFALLHQMGESTPKSRINSKGDDLRKGNIYELLLHSDKAFAICRVFLQQ